jgi:hypothetical protein
MPKFTDWIDGQSTPPITDPEIDTIADALGVEGGTLGDQIDALAEEVDALTAGTGTSSGFVSEIFSDVTGTVTPTVAESIVIDVASTAGDWELNLSGMPQNRPAVVWVKIDSSGAHTPTFPDTVFWESGGAPSGTLWADGKRAVIRFTRVPFTDQIEAELVASGDTPDTDDIDPATPVTATFTYSTSNLRTGLTALSAATLPAGEVAIVIGPFDATIKSIDIWHDHSGALPAVGSEATVDSYIGRRTTYPYDFLGGTTTATMWDTNFDPTGNSRAGYDPNGSNVIDIRFTYTDDTTSTGQVTFNTGNAGTSTFAMTYGDDSTVGSSSTTDVTIPSADDRAVLAVFFYRADKVMTGATLGGTAMTVVDSRYDAASDNGTMVLSMVEAAMPAAGTRALVPSYDGTIFPISISHVHYWVAEGVTDAGFTASALAWNNGIANVDLALVVPDNAPVMMAVSHQTAAGTLTNNWDGTAETALVTNDSYDMTSQAEWKSDAGAASTVSVTWVPSAAKSMGVMVYLEADVISDPGPTPITPGTPTATTPTNPDDNQLATTWAATTDATYYEGQIGTTNPPTTSVINLGDVTAWTRSGLSPSTLYYMRVRAVSSTATRSAWSAVVSGTTNASTVVVPPVDTGRFVYGQFADLNTLSHTFGRDMRTDGINVPNWHFHANLGPTWGNVVYATRKDADVYPKAFAAWNQNTANRPSAITDMGPKTFITTKLSFEGNHYGNVSNAELAVLDLARSGSTGTDNRRSGWNEIGANLAAWGLGTQFISLSHESNGYWYANFSGVDTNLIGSPALANVTNSQFGTEMATAVRGVAVDGNIAPVHKIAAQNAATELWKTNPALVICYTLADGAASTPPSAPPGGNLASTWQDAAHPDPEYFDVFAQTVYCRGGGRPIYKGSGDVDATSSYTYRFDGVNSPFAQKLIEWNRPGGFWEFGANWDIYDLPPTYSDGPTDNQSNVFWKYATEWMPQLDLAFITYWNAGDDNAPGSTYQLPYANYGVGNWTGSNPKFPKTTTTLAGIY